MYYVNEIIKLYVIIDDEQPTFFSRSSLLMPDHKTVFDFTVECTNSIQILVLAGCTNWAIWADLRFGFVQFHRYTRVKLKCVLSLGGSNAS